MVFTASRSTHTFYLKLNYITFFKDRNINFPNQRDSFAINKFVLKVFDDNL